MDFDLDHSIAVLERTPRVLGDLLAGLPAGWLAGNEGPDTWSPIEIVAHLLGAEREDWMVRARMIVAQGPDRRFRPFDRVGPIQRARGQPLEALIAQFSDLRQRNLTELTGWHLAPEQLGLTGEHPEFGTVTLAQLLATWAVHDLSHLAQIGRVMAKQYGTAVGPWRAYLPILARGGR
jgi:hypothetical protein